MKNLSQSVTPLDERPIWRYFMSAVSSLILIAQAAEFQNGSFEEGAHVDDGAFLDLDTGDQRLFGWRVTGAGGTLDVFNGAMPPGIPFGAVDGTRYLLFNGGDFPPGRQIEQTFDTVVGLTYTVSFSVGRVGGGTGLGRITAAAFSHAGTVLGSIDASTSEKDAFKWLSPVSFTFAAATQETTLRFTDTSVATVGTDVLLDAVSVSKVGPEAKVALYPGIEVTGDVGKTYEVQYRDGLEETAAWQQLAVIKLEQPSELVFDPSGLNSKYRFYRIVERP